MIKIVSGVNEITLQGEQSVATIRHQAAQILQLSGDEKAEVNGVEVTGEDIVHNGETLEFVKATGQKGATVKVTSGVNELNLDVVGDTVADVRESAGQILGLTSEHRAELNGEEADEDEVLEEGDELEFVKNTGTKGH